MRLSCVSGLILVLLASGATSPAARAHSANNDFRIGAGWLEPSGETTAGGVQYDTASTTGYFVNYERRLIPWLGIDLDVLYANPDVSTTPVGGGATQTQAEQTLVGNAGLNFHVLARSRVDLYMGVYAAYADFANTFDNSSGYGALAGIDVGLTKSGLALTASVRYTKLEASFTQIPGATSSYDPLLAQLGIGWRF